jgi:hypothetical protein
MESMTKSLVSKLAVLLGFAAMMIVNWLSVIGDINGVTTAAVSDAHKTLFTPEGYTFSIWGIIYLLLLVYVLFQLFSKELGRAGKHAKIAYWFVVSCIANIGWIFAWHYGQIVVSAIVMLVLLYCLTRIMSLTADIERSVGTIFTMELPFGLYAGWITVAAIANIAAMLLDIGWDGFGVPHYIWFIIVLLLATFIVIAATRDTHNIAYPAAVIWGLTGILVPYLPGFTFDVQNDSMWMVLTLGLSLLIITIRWIDIIVRRVR